MYTINYRVLFVPPSLESCAFHTVSCFVLYKFWNSLFCCYIKKYRYIVISPFILLPFLWWSVYLVCYGCVDRCVQ